MTTAKKCWSRQEELDYYATVGYNKTWIKKAQTALDNNNLVEADCWLRELRWQFYN